MQVSLPSVLSLVLGFHNTVFENMCPPSPNLGSIPLHHFLIPFTC